VILYHVSFFSLSLGKAQQKRRRIPTPQSTCNGLFEQQQQAMPNFDTRGMTGMKMAHVLCLRLLPSFPAHRML
jgi:hypothetical protein